MPKRPKTVCRKAGCGALVDAPGFCERCQTVKHKQDAEHRGTAHERGYTTAWTKAREHYLRAHPLCVHCRKEKRITAATVVDHIVPHRLKQAIDSGVAALIEAARALFWDSKNNWQSLCKRHHDVKTATEDGGFGRPINKNKEESA
jgi:5-methylcytosine-specific restriction protein A